MTDGKKPETKEPNPNNDPVMMMNIAKKVAALRVESAAIRVYDTGAPRGERNLWVVELNGTAIFETFRRADAEKLRDSIMAVALYAAPISGERVIPAGHCTLFVHHSSACAQQAQCLAVSGERVREALTDKELIDAWNSARVPDGHLPDGIGLVEQYLRHMRAVAEAQINKSALPLAAI